MKDCVACETLIRSGAIEDLPLLVDIQRRASLKGYPEPMRTLLESRPELISESFQRQWFADDQVRVASREQRIVGFAVLERSGSDEGEMIALFVEPDCWRTGVGKALVDTLVALASRRGERRIVVTANPLALDFYAAAGFILERYVDMANAAAVPRLVLQVPPYSDAQLGTKT